jgi:zinc D-Ala-D-Ala carboxypeptidase
VEAMRLRSVLLVAFFALLIAACGSGQAGGNGVTVRTPTAPPEATQPGGEPSSPEPTATPGEPAATLAPGETPDPSPDATDTPPSQPTSTPDTDGVVLLACNDPLAPVDKQHRLARDCVPANLVALPAAYSYGEEQLLTAPAADALVEMLEAAIDDGYYIYARSSYRSYDTQVATYNYWISVYGREYADRISARPGHSEHQLGTTTDVVSASSGYQLDAFRGTPEAAWIAENSWRFGFIVSYPESKEHITGYVYEPWHIRYVGRDVAANVRASGLTLGEYLHSIR